MGERKRVVLYGQSVILGAVQAGGVEEGDLRPGPVAHPQDAGAGGLRARGDDGDVLAQDAVEQRRLADVGPADDGHRPGAKRLLGLARHRGGRAAARAVAPVVGRPALSRRCA